MGRELPPSPDGGWGWVIVFACFVLQGMIDGLFAVFGVFLPEFLEYYGASRAKTAIIGSLLSAFLLISGPFMSVLISFIGCRKVAVLGGFFITIGLLLSTLAPTMDVLIVTFGVISGLGLGLIFQPSIVMVGFWFEKKRAIAMGIATSGAGIGMLVMATLSGALLDHFDWKNSLVFICGVTMQVIVCGCLLRPVEYGYGNKDKSNDENNDIKCQENKMQNEGPKTVTNITESNGYIVVPSIDLDDVEGCRVRTISTSSCDRAILKKKNLKPSPLTLDDSVETSNTQTGNATKLQQHTFFSQELPVDRHTGSFTNLRHTTASNPLLRKDIFYSGSIQNIPEHSKSSQLNIKIEKEQQITDQPEKTSCLDKDYFLPMKEMLSIHILKDPSFIIISIANSLMQAGFILCIYFATDYGISLGIKPDTAAYLVSIYGIGTTLGRFSSGVVTTLPYMNAVHVTSVSLIISGVFAISTALFCKSFLSLAICIGCTGFFVAPIIPLTSVTLVDYMGLDHLTNAHGMVSLAKGISSLFSSPLAGFLQDTTGSYTPPFYLAGSIFILAGVLHALLPIFHKRH